MVGGEAPHYHIQQASVV